jgi:hypothetical protein
MYDYDILRKSADGSIVWVECVKHFHEARRRLKELAARVPGEYIAFSQATHEVVASTADSTLSANARGVGYNLEVI